MGRDLDVMDAATRIHVHACTHPSGSAAHTRHDLGRDARRTSERGRLEALRKFCSRCHEHPQDRIPAREGISRGTPDEVLQILTNGLVGTQAAGLNMNDRMAVATFVTGRPPSGNTATVREGNLCAKHGPRHILVLTCAAHVNIISTCQR